MVLHVGKPFRNRLSVPAISTYSKRVAGDSAGDATTEAQAPSQWGLVGAQEHALL